jgi:hypothetical protein
MPPGPLLQFQSTVYERDDVFKLLNSINEATQARLPSGRLHGTFEMWWPKLQEKLEAAKDLFPVEDAKKVKRPVDEMVAELLSLARTQQRMLYELDQRTPRRTALTVELEALQKLAEELLRQGRITPYELSQAVPAHSSRRYRDWMMYVTSRPRIEPASEESKSSDDL